MGLATTLRGAWVGIVFLTLASPAFAGVSPATPCSTSTTDAKAFVDDRLVFWQERLQFGDWKISVVMTRRSELKAKTLGGIRWDKGKKTASMAIMDVADYNKMSCAEMLADMEFTIVHELVHLELASLPKSEASRSNEEFAVNRIAEALLKLSRQE